MMGAEGKKLSRTVFAEVVEALKKDVPEITKIAGGDF
jgi:hypothetical protein